MFRAIAIAAVALPFMLAGCEVEQTEEGEAPDVDVQGGKLPEYDVDAPDVEVNREQRDVTVPDVDVDVDREKRTVTVPDVDVTPADKDAD